MHNTPYSRQISFLLSHWIKYNQKLSILIRIWTSPLILYTVTSPSLDISIRQTGKYNFTEKIFTFYTNSQDTLLSPTNVGKDCQVFQSTYVTSNYFVYFRDYRVWRSICLQMCGFRRTITLLFTVSNSPLVVSTEVSGLAHPTLH